MIDTVYLIKGGEKNMRKISCLWERRWKISSIIALVCVVILVFSNLPSDLFSLKATAEKNSSFHPNITLDKGVNYTGNTGYEPWYYYIGGVINSANGNLYLSEKDISIKARGFDIEIIRSYNSHNSNFSTAFGYGWTFNYNVYIVDKGSYAIFVDGDGSFHNFISTGGGNYTAPPGVYLRLNKYPDDTFILWFKDGMTYHFDSGGILQNITDKNDNTLTFTYSGGKLVKVEDDSGVYVTFNYNSEHRISSIRDVMGREITYEYDLYGNLVKVTDAMGNFTRYIYYCCHDIATVVDKMNVALTFSYYANNTRTETLKKVRDIRNSVYGNATYHNPFMVYFVVYENETVYFLDANNYASAVKMNQFGNPVQIIDSLDGKTKIGWINNTIVNITDENGNTYSSQYDQYGNLLQRTDPLGYKTLYEWNVTDNSTTYLSLLINITKVCYERGAKVEIFNDTMENGTNGWTASPNWTQWAADFHSPVTSWTCGGGFYGQGWDETLDSPSINLSGFIDAELSFWHKGDFEDDFYLYDGGNVKVSTDGGNNWTLITPYGGYDGKIYYGWGNPLEVERAFGHSFNWTKERFDLSAYVGMASNVKVRFEMGTDSWASADTGWSIDDVVVTAYVAIPRYITTIISYDENGNVIEIQDATGNSSYYEYDTYGNLINATDFRGYSTLFDYDVYGNIINITNPLMNVTRFAYDAVGRLINVTDANGHSTLYVYDNNDRIVKVIDATGNETTYNYNANGALVGMTDANGKQTNYTYNVVGKIEKVEDATGNTSYYQYDRTGKIVSASNAKENTTTT